MDGHGLCRDANTSTRAEKERKKKKFSEPYYGKLLLSDWLTSV
jgi:hypothetical protein